MKAGQWATDGKIVWPVNDTHEHDLDNEACECGAFKVDGILVHNAFDGRQYEERRIAVN
jgi:hypothetical protein